MTILRSFLLYFQEKECIKVYTDDVSDFIQLKRECAGEGIWVRKTDREYWSLLIYSKKRGRLIVYREPQRYFAGSLINGILTSYPPPRGQRRYRFQFVVLPSSSQVSPV
jgi:hypothetical protein